MARISTFFAFNFWMTKLCTKLLVALEFTIAVKYSVLSINIDKIKVGCVHWGVGLTFR